ncbi:tetratricopeptide repeat protein [Phormidesmis sp. 146-35]
MPTIEIRQTSGFEAIVAIAGSEFEIAVGDPFAEQDEKQLEWYFEEWIKFPFSDETIAKQVAESVRSYGENLFQQVFGDPEAYAAYKSLKVSELEILIKGSPEFQGLHWEAMRDPKAAHPLAINGVMVRQKRVQGKAITRAIEPSTVLNLLIVTARPNEEKDVGYRTISRPMVEAIRDGQLPVNVEIVRPGTYKAFLDHVEGKPEGFYHVVHFDLHGGLMAYEQFQKTVPTGEKYLFQRGPRLEKLPEYAGVKAFLFFEGDESGQAVAVTADEIVGELQDRGIPVCILNACQSGKQVRANGDADRIDERETSLGARLMDAGMQMVVAMAYSVTVDAAKVLMQRVYGELFAGEALSKAVRAGRRELFDRKSRSVYFNQQVDLEDWLLPVVYGNQPVNFGLREMTFAESDAYFANQGTEYRFAGATYGFVGRDLDILKLEKGLLRHGVMLLQGMGGTGKTTLLRYLQDWWVQTGFVERVFYFGYDVRAWTLEQMMFEIASVIFSDVEMRQFQAMRLEARVGRLVQVLRSRRYGLMLDNLESVTGQALAIQNTLPGEEQGRIREFLDRIAGGKSIALLGSRSREEWLKSAYRDNRYELRGLDQEARSQLAKKVLERHVLDGAKRKAILADREFERLMRLLAGYPLAIEVVLANLGRQSVAQVLAGLDAADVKLDRPGEKTESILKCVEYSHSNLSAEAQKLLLCLAPFSGVFNRLVLPTYAKQLKKLEPFQEYRFEQFDEAIQEAVSWGLLSPIPIDNPNLLEIQPVFPYFLKTKLDQLDVGTCEAISESFKNLYQELAEAFDQLMNSKKPQDRQQGIDCFRWESENLFKALKICLEKQECINISFCLGNYFDVINDSRSELELSTIVCNAIDTYSESFLSSNLGYQAAWDYTRRAIVSTKFRRYSEAKRLYEKAIEVLDSLSNIQERKKQLWKADNYYNLGFNLQEMRQYGEARHNYRKALQIYVEYNDCSKQANIYTGLGTVAREMREYEEARHNYRQALQIFIELNDRYNQSGTHNNLGVVAQDIQDYEEAWDNYEQALQILVEFNDRYKQGSIYANLGIVANNSQKYEKAYHCYRQALQIFIEFNDRYSQARIYYNLSTMAREIQEYEKAEHNCRQALQIFIEFGDRHSQALTYYQLGRVAQELRQCKEARHIYLQALQIFIEFKDRFYQARIHNQLGLLAEAEGDVSGARAYLQTAMGMYAELNNRYYIAMTQMTQRNLDRLSE